MGDGDLATARLHHGSSTLHAARPIDLTMRGGLVSLATRLSLSDSSPFQLLEA